MFETQVLNQLPPQAGISKVSGGNLIPSKLGTSPLLNGEGQIEGGDFSKMLNLNMLKNEPQETLVEGADSKNIMPFLKNKNGKNVQKGNSEEPKTKIEEILSKKIGSKDLETKQAVNKQENGLFKILNDPKLVQLQNDLAEPSSQMNSQHLNPQGSLHANTQTHHPNILMHEKEEIINPSLLRGELKSNIELTKKDDLLNIVSPETDKIDFMNKQQLGNFENDKLLNSGTVKDGVTVAHHSDPHQFVKDGLKNIENSKKVKNNFFISNKGNEDLGAKEGRVDLDRSIFFRKEPQVANPALPTNQLNQKNIGEYAKTQNLNSKSIFDTQINKLAKGKDSVDHFSALTELQDTSLKELPRFQGNDFAPVKVINLNSISGNNSTQNVITQIENYIQQSAVANEKSVGLIFQHDQLGHIGLNVDKLQGNEISIKIMTSSDSGAEFFNAHKNQMVSSLSESGHNIFDFKVDNSAGFLHSAGKSFLAESSSNQMNTSQNNSFDSESKQDFYRQDQFDRNSNGGQSDQQRRRDLWEKALNKDIS